MYSHIFVDFDETLFNHLAYAEWADTLLADRLGKPKGFFLGRFDEFHEQLDDPLLRLFKHAEHTLATTGHDWSYISGELEYAASRLEQDFCYPDSHACLEFLKGSGKDIRILTFGDEAYQRYKINTCHVIKRLGIPVHVVTEAKRDFLAHRYGSVMAGLLIDDKYPLKLAEPWKQVWINRKDTSKPQQLPDGTWRIKALTQIEQLIDI